MQHSKLFSHSLVWKCFLSNMNDSLTCIISLCPFILNILDLKHSHKCTYHIVWDTGKRGDLNYAFSRTVASIRFKIFFSLLYQRSSQDFIWLVLPNSYIQLSLNFLPLHKATDLHWMLVWWVKFSLPRVNLFSQLVNRNSAYWSLPAPSFLLYCHEMIIIQFKGTILCCSYPWTTV